jgi:hypothetical protein
LLNRVSWKDTFTFCKNLRRRTHHHTRAQMATGQKPTEEK